MKGGGRRAEGGNRGSRIAEATNPRPRRSALFLLSLCPLVSQAQAPDIRARLDLALSFDYRDADRQSARLYSPLGRPSTVSLSVLLESGYGVFVSERLQRLPRDFDDDFIDEGYVEDPGIFRVGKQYVPFGAGRILHESALGARIDSNLIAEGAPVTLVALNGGAGRQNGAVLRVGRNVGVSVAYGSHFGVAGTSLGLVRRPEDAPGRGGGWKQAYGLDASRRYGKLALSAEAAILNAGEEPDLNVIDLETTYYSDGYRTIGLGYTNASGRALGGQTFRLFGRVHASRNLDAEPLVRLRDGRLYDAAVTLRLRF